MGIFSDDGQLHRIEERLARVEEKLDRLLSQQSQQGLSGQDLSRAMGEVEEPWMREVRALLRRNLKIEAIKVYREHTGVSLKEAKDAVEAME